MEILDKIISEGKKYGDVIVLKKNVNQVASNFSNKEVKTTTEGNTTQLLIRVSKDKKFGYSTTSDFSKWKKCLIDAVNIMKASKKMKNEILLAKPQKFNTAEMIYSGRLKELPTEKMVEKGYSIIKEIKKEFEIPMLSINKSFEETEIANSEGLFAKERETSFSTMVEVKSGESSATDFKVSRDLFDPVYVGKEAEKLCLKCMNPKSIQTFRGSLILDYFAFAGFIENILIPAVSADEIHSKRSPLSKKIGEKVFSENFTVVDDGLMDKGLLSGSFDYEGTPYQKKVIFDKGVFKKPLYDIYSAKKDKTQSTGNCGGLDRIPSIKPTNFIVSPGTYSKEEIISDTKKGALATFAMGYHLVNQVTGDCSLGIENSFYIENGEVKFPIKQAMVSFNLFEQLKKLEIIGKNLRQETSVVAPIVKFEDVQIIG